jgi:hypothetical protein
MKRHLGVLGVGAVLAVLVAGASAFANFRVTDERTGQTFIATEYLHSPYECAAPCAFAFEAIPACGGAANPSFVWGVRDGAEQTFANASGRSWRYEFTALGDYSVWETESTATCGTGGTFRLRVLDKTPPEISITSGPSAVTDDSSPSFEFAASEPAQRSRAASTVQRSRRAGRRSLHHRSSLVSMRSRSRRLMQQATPIQRRRRSRSGLQT